VADLKIPYRDRDQRLDDPGVLDLPRALEDRDERAVADHLLIEAMADPSLHTVGDLLDRIERASPRERRRIADQARAETGLKTFTAIEWEAAQERHRRAAAPRRDADRRALQICNEPGCAAQAINPATGAPEPVAAKRWWCPEHRAGHEDDMRPWTHTYRYSETGLLVDVEDDVNAELEQRRSEGGSASA
jgi:hypothetical protein